LIEYLRENDLFKSAAPLMNILQVPGLFGMLIIVAEYLFKNLGQVMPVSTVI